VTVSSAASGLELDKLFPFALDAFQTEAIAALEAGRSVVVCAPTGSGKTLIGEYAIYRALARSKRVFYTTPLKALSNQKLRDFRDTFGAENVGLLTGDVSINRDAPIVVMTTEIFRNMLYGTTIGQVGTSLIDVEAVVLDECHYMNDRQRGTVWEESIIYCPPNIQLVALSATVANSDQLTDWIRQVHGPTDLIYSDFRPVPLTFHFCNLKGVFPLLEPNSKRMNPRLKPRGGKGARGDRGRVPRQETPGLAFALSEFKQRDMLPAIYFIFSRRGCDQAMQEVSRLPLKLLTSKETDTLKEQIDRFLAENPELAHADLIPPLYKGIAAHHAGVLPAWKGLIEELFQQGLIKVVFATETLAAGINMPARTTVISSLSKRTDTGHRLLTASEFLQMAGRAGRRGMDVQGHVVTMQSAFEGAREATYLATSGADPLVSQFTPSYGMVLNLLQMHSLEEAKELIERSFGQYLATLYLRPQQEAIATLEAEAERLNRDLAEVDWQLFAQYEKLQERLREEKRLLKYLQDQAAEVQQSDLPLALSFAIVGTVISLKGKHIQVSEPIPAVLVSKVPGSGQFPYLVCLGRDNQWYVVTVKDVTSLRGEVPRLSGVDYLTPPAGLAISLGSTFPGNDESAAIAQQIPLPPPLAEAAPEVYEQLQRMTLVEEQVQLHPVHQWRHRGNLQKRRRHLDDIEADIRDRKAKLERQTHRHWQEFLGLIEILKEFNCLEDFVPTEVGQTTAAIRGDNELWLGLALMSGELEGLSAVYFASACAALVTEVSRPDSWTRFDPAPEVEEALAGLRSIRRRLFQLQRRYEVVFPVWLEYDLVGIVEQWARGIEWLDLCANVSLDEGDIVRILRRTLDFLSQIPHAPHISSQLKATAREAIALLDRFPINETVE